MRITNNTNNTNIRKGLKVLNRIYNLDYILCISYDLNYKQILIYIAGGDEHCDVYHCPIDQYEIIMKQYTNSFDIIF